MFLAPVDATAHLQTSASQRLWTAFTPATFRAYARMFKDFLTFLSCVSLSLPQVVTQHILAFMEHLHQAGLSPSNITNYVTAIRSMYIIHACDTTIFRDRRIPLLIKPLKISRNLQPVLPLVLDQEILVSIISTCDVFHSPLVFKSLYLFAFFSFLRLSNLLPHVATKFDHTRHLRRGDVIFDQHAAIIVVKWSKTLQDRHIAATIAVPYLGDNLLCPVTAIKNLLMLTPSSSNNNPLFQICKAGVWQPLTDSQARKHLKSVCVQ